jgi:hypothetical protein
MRPEHRLPIKVSAALVVGLATQLVPTQARATCCEVQNVPVYVHAEFVGAAPGDMVGNRITRTSMLAPVIGAIEAEYPTVEIYTHVFHLDDATGRWISESTGDNAQVTQGWTCSHPLDPYDMDTMRPGVLVQAPSDGLMDGVNAAGQENEVQATQSTPWGIVIAGDDAALDVMGAPGDTSYTDVVAAAGNAACTATALYDGYESPGGYHLYAFSHFLGAGVNGQCADYLTNFCGVPRNTPLTYASNYAYNAASAMFSAIYNECNAGLSWIDNFLCAGACDSAANQVVNTFLENSAWGANNTFEDGVPAISGVMTPGNLMTKGGTRVPPPITASAGAWTTMPGRVCHAGACY